MIISGFPGIGKTTIGKKYKNIIDLDAMPYIYELTNEQKNMSYEKLKGLDTRIKNNKWPNNYIDEILEKQKIYDIVLISQHKELLEELSNRKIEYIVAFPEKDCIEEYMERYSQRGNSKEYISKKRNTFYAQINYLTENSENIIVLRAGEYLEDVLLKKGILLEKGKNQI